VYNNYYVLIYKQFNVDLQLSDHQCLIYVSVCA